MPTVDRNSLSALSVLSFLSVVSVLFVIMGSVFGFETAESQSNQANQTKRRHRPVPVPDDAPENPENLTACNYQTAQSDWVRANYVVRGRLSREERRARNAKHQAFIRYRTEHYGYFQGFGQRAWNASSPSQNAHRVSFMGKRVRLNKKITPALTCIEEQIKSECGDSYQPQRLSGIRNRNTYHNNEVSNHVYGIAIDVDPTRNTCCGCVAQWGDHPLCQRDAASVYDRMAMPACWVHVFERFGFYWLGRDRMQDTMHFEFLGDPDNITRTAQATPAPTTSTQEQPAD